MKLNAVSCVDSLRAKPFNQKVVTEPISVPKDEVNTIAFKSGNPKHVFHQISELSLFGLGSGGVGTVGNDLFFNHVTFPFSEFSKIKFDF